MKNKKITKLFSLVLFIALAVTTVFGMGVFQVSAAEAFAAPTSLKFRQIELGSDFAVALSYDGELYGWSLTRSQKTFGAKTTSLGNYYPGVPTRIDFKFVEVKKEGGSQSINCADGPFVTDDAVVDIAATETTAALLTRKGYIYTWGQDQTEEQDSGTVPMNLLQRVTGEDNAGGYYMGNGDFYTPAIINYNVTNLSFINPANTASVAADKPIVDIAAGDSNYLVKVTRAASVNQGKTDYFYWGNSRFGQHNDASLDVDKQSTYGFYSKDDLLLPSNVTAMFAGAGNVVAVGSDKSLYLKGKNYYLPSGELNVSGSGSDLGLTDRMFNTVSSSFDRNIYVDIGGVKTKLTGALVSEKNLSKVNNSAKFDATVKTAKFADAKGDALTVDGAEYARVLDKISLSNGFGYAIGEDNKVYFFGNGYNGQAGSITGANKKAYNDLTALTLPGGAGTPVQVVAGKISAPTNSFNISEPAALKAKLGTLNANKITVEAAKQEQNDTTPFVSAVLDANGKVFAWSNTVSAQEIDLSNKTGANNKIVSLSGGYNGTLFALSQLGKIFQISALPSGFSVKLLDEFQYVSGNTPSVTLSTVTNFETEKTNAVRFSVSNDRAAADPLKFNFSADSIVISGEAERAANAYSTVFVNGQAATSAAGANNLKPFVSSNISEDATRLLLSSAQVGSSFITSADTVTGFSDQTMLSAVSGSAPTAGFADVKFYWSNDAGKTPLDLKVINKYIAFSVSYNSELSFNIIPYQSTMGRTLRMEFGVGRFDSSLNYALSGSSAVFYEAKRATLDITIDNTDSRVDNLAPFVGTPAAGAENTYNASIPLLDPNNFYAKYYSIALMDVSTGLTEISKILNGGSEDSTITSALIALANARDEGFPSSGKISDGALSYYYGSEANRYFNNKYPFIASDRDGNRVVFQAIQSYDAYTKYFTAEPKTVTVSYPLGSVSVNDAQKMFLTNDSLFNNLYGFVFGVDAIDNELDITYQVILLTAKASTGTAMLEENVIDGIKTTALPDANGIMDFRVSLNECKNFAADAIGGNLQKAYDTQNFPVHVQASLSIKDEKAGGKHTVYGDASSNKNILNEVTPTLVVSGANGTYTYNVASLFNDTANIFFAYKGEKAQGSVADAFVASFDKQLTSMTISPTEFTITAKEATTLKFTLEVRRYNADKKIKKSDSADTEFINIKFVVNCANPQLSLKAGAESEYKLNQQTKDQGSSKLIRSLSLNSRIVAADETWQLTDTEFAVVSVFSTDPNILKASVQRVGSERKIVLEGLTSGKVTVRYGVKLYDSEPLWDSFDVKVESIVQYRQTINLRGPETIYLSDLTDDLRKKNESSSDCNDYEGLVLNTSSEKENPQEALYYQRRKSGEDWSAITGGKIPFLKDVLFQYESANPDKCAAIRLDIEDVVNPDDYEYRFVLKFKSLDNVYNFEIAIVVSPGKKQLKDGINDLSLVLHTDKSKASSAEFELDGSGKVPKYKINVTTILKFLSPKDYTSWVDSKIFTVNYGKGTNLTNSELVKYTDLSFDENSFYLTMKYPTKELEGGRLPVDLTIQKDSGTVVLSFYVQIDGIRITLDKKEYGMIFGITFGCVFALLFIIFMIRMGVFWKKKAEQKRIIRKNQMLIKMRDKMHNRTDAVSKGQIVKTKLKMEDPKYAKMFTQMRREKEAETGISLDNSVVAHKAETKVTAADKAAKNSKKKKGGGKKSIEELKAELEAKKAAFAAMQRGDIPGGEGMGGPIIDDSPVFEASTSYSGELSREDVENQIKAKLAADEENILFDVDVIPDDKNNA